MSPKPARFRKSNQSSDASHRVGVGGGGGLLANILKVLHEVLSKKYVQ